MLIWLHLSLSPAACVWLLATNCIRVLMTGCSCRGANLAAKQVSAPSSNERAAPFHDALRALNAANSMYGGWVVLTAAAGVSRVPYIGWKGDFSKLDVLDFIVVSKFDLLGTNDLNRAAPRLAPPVQWSCDYGTFSHPDRQHQAHTCSSACPRRVCKRSPML